MRVEFSSLSFNRQYIDPRPRRRRDFLYGLLTGIGLVGVYKGIKEYKGYKDFKKKMSNNA